MKRSLVAPSRLVVSLLAILLALGLASCSNPQGLTNESDSIGFQAGDGSSTIIPTEQREPAPILAGETLDGDHLSTADFPGQMLLINVWGSWCAPCRAEAPALVEVAEQMPEVQFIGVNTRDLNPAPANAFVRAFDLPYPSIYDPDGSQLLDFGQLPPQAIPSTLIIDAEGRVAARILGEASAATFAGVIEEVKATT